MVDHRACDRVEKQCKYNSTRGYYGVCKLVSLFLHLFPVAGVHETLREENSVIIDHQEDMVKILLMSLSLEEIEAHGSNRSDQFHPHSVSVTISGVYQ